ncbi:MAG: hypothetical protein J6X10_08090 [Bacteroidales bacterium]|nr:hypothetical protein [Bacteroidales bacterium]
MKRNLLLLICAVLLAFVSCKNETKTFEPETYTVGTGVFILNEGTFTYANSSLSFYDFDKDKATNNLFFRVNNAPIGDVGQSLALVDDNLYIVVNNSKYIYKVNAKTIEYKDKIDGFTSPRNMYVVGENKTYVTDIASPGFWTLNLSNNEKHLVNTGKATECMAQVGNEVFVSNWSKSYVDFENNTVQVIDCENDELVAEIVVAQEPKAMVVDKNNMLWVICNGGWDPMQPQDPALICINPATREIVKRFDFTPGVDSPDGLAIDAAGENIFFMNGFYGGLNIYKMSVDAEQVPDTPLILSNGKLFYNLAVNPGNGDIYVTDAKNYVQNGDLVRYSADGTLLGTYEMGIIPSYMLFN